MRPAWSDALRRGIDIGVAALLLVPSIPVLLAATAWICLDSPGNPLFTQTRVGRGGRTFTIFKLRTFHSDQHGIFPDEEIRSGDPRVTRAGNVLRRCKLDELPQLVNVLIGDMALVGPRPDIPVQARHYGPAESVRLAVRPGLTGVAQISGNTFLSWADRIRLDRWYIAHRSLSLDALIMAHTVPLMLRGERPDDDPLGARARMGSPDDST